MKLKFYSLITVLFLSIGMYSQAQQVNSQQHSPFKKLPIISHPTKAKALASRLVGQVVFNPDTFHVFQINDSVRVSYTGTNNMNSKGELIYDLGFVWNYNSSISTYDNSSKFTQTLDSKENIISSTSFLWDAASNSYINDYISNYTFDANNNQTGSTSQTWNITGSVWVNSSKVVSTFDANNNLITYISQAWDVPSSAWINSYKNISTYDANHNLLTQISQNWNTALNVWDNSAKSTLTYNAGNKNLTSIYEYWNGTSWDLNNKYINTYNASNDLINSINQYWDIPTSVWINLSQDYHQLNTSHKDTISLSQSWDPTTSVWVNSSKNIFTYDVNQNLMQSIYLTWDFTLSKFVNNSRDRYSYNTFNQQTLNIKDSWDVTSSNWRPDDLNNDRMYKSYYETFQSNGLENINSNDGNLSIYPNPSNNVLNIQLNWKKNTSSVISIINTNGMLMKQWSAENGSNYNTTISTNELPSGNYILSIRDKDGNKLSEKFIVTK